MKDAIFTLIQVAGGLGLFLFGMKLMGEGLENAAGDKLKSILEKVTKNPISAVLVGAFVTMVIQSSSATTVMVVGFVNAGLMNIAQAAGVIMGANVGTTITAQLVAFKLDEIAPLFVIIGVVLLMSAKQKKRKDIADIILGFGILFMGMGIMSSALKPLADSPMFSELIMAIGENWVLGIFTGLALTAILQSSSATTGILIALASTGSININIVLPILFGCNIGTCVTALIASIGANKTAHKAAAIHLMFNILGTLIFIPFLKPLAYIVQEISPGDVQRQIANVIRKGIKDIIEKDKKNLNISTKLVEKYLGPKIFSYEEIDKEDKVGVVTGMAWTAYGGDTLPVEVMVMDGKGRLELTGQLGDVMKESAKAAYSYVRAHMKELGIKDEFYSKKDIHIHAPEGAVPKDGPSAGVTMTTALVSALTGKKVKHNVAMTGEITLTGKVLAIGGLKEKCLAARRVGIDTVIVPKENEKDVIKLPKIVKDSLNIILADKIDDVLENALVGVEK